MATKRQFFEPGDFPDEDYCSLRDKPHCVNWRAHCEALWERYAPYADPHFLDEVRRQFHPRFWEMYLAVTFLERGYQLRQHPHGGPEFAIDVGGQRYWFDAIAPTAGSGADAVPDLGDGGWVPTQQIILRYTSALTEKRRKWQKDLESGRVSEQDGFIVAINDSLDPLGVSRCGGAVHREGVEPSVPLPLGALRFYREYWVEGDQLIPKDWSMRDAPSAET